MQSGNRLQKDTITVSLFIQNWSFTLSISLFYPIEYIEAILKSFCVSFFIFTSSGLKQYDCVHGATVGNAYSRATQRNVYYKCKHEWSTCTQISPLDAERIGCMLLFLCEFRSLMQKNRFTTQRSPRKGKSLKDNARKSSLSFFVFWT